MDNLRVLLIAGVVVVHTATAYVVDVPWYYDDERSAAEPWSTVVSVPTLVGGVFALGPLFLLAGWFSVRSLAHRGPGGFVRTRLLRLGVPLLAFVLVLQPLTDWVGNLRDERGSFLYYLGSTEMSVMWFVAALLAFSLAYAGLRRVRPRLAPPTREPLGAGVLAAAALTIAAGSWTVWQAWPWGADTVLKLRLGEWPQGAVLFAVGVWAAEAGSLDLPAMIRRRLGRVALAGLIAFVVLVCVEGAREEVDALLEQDIGWPTLTFAVLDGVLAVTGTLWLVSWLRARWNSHGRMLEGAGRASYATYVMHPLVLTTLMQLFAPVELGAQLKFVLLALLGVPACFAVGYALTRVPGLRAVL